MAGRKQWTSFERLNAADVNSYLADQSVMRFVTAAARDVAIPLPEVGMIVTRDDNGGKPEYWDGAAWRLVSAGAQTSNVLTRIDPRNTGKLTTSGVAINGSTGTWTEVTAGIAQDVVIYSYSHRANASVPIEIGTGAAGSEVRRWLTTLTHTSGADVPIVRSLPFGIFVPAGTRIAYRSAAGSVLGSYLLLSYGTVQSGLVSASNVITASVPASSTAWVEAGATPPIAGGVYVIGAYINNSIANPLNDFRFGTGAAGAEAVATGYHQLGRSSSQSDVSYIPPFFWPASTRLAVQASAVNADAATVAIVWREHLT